jgi:hypothetical protein
MPHFHATPLPLRFLLPLRHAAADADAIAAAGTAIIFAAIFAFARMPTVSPIFSLTAAMIAITPPFATPPLIRRRLIFAS